MKYHSIYAALLICVLFSFISCDEDDASPDTNGTGCVTMSGYTYKDQLNIGNGVVDTTDWRLDDNWSQCEKNIFGGTNFNTNCLFDDTLLTNPGCFPNPTTDIFRIEIGIQVFTADTNLANSIALHDSTIKMDLVVLNQRNQVVGRINSNKYAQRVNYYSLDLMDPSAVDTIFRVYYKLTDLNNCVKMGHGDIIRH